MMLYHDHKYESTFDNVKKHISFEWKKESKLCKQIHNIMIKYKTITIFKLFKYTNNTWRFNIIVIFYNQDVISKILYCF